MMRNVVKNKEVGATRWAREMVGPPVTEEAGALTDEGKLKPYVPITEHA